jgi:uncharacterized protein YbjT (DUF2867 family)
MKILLTGATGFIGTRLLRALLAQGHEVVCATRRTGAPRLVEATNVIVDFSTAVDAASWKAALDGVEVVINTVGIFRESKRQTFDALHRQAPCALFAASVAAGVQRIVQLSALGADQGAQTHYHRSKKAADDYLLSLPVSAAVVQPSLVYGPGGASARFFEMLASMPIIPLPGNGGQRIQPVHVDDLVLAICALVDAQDLQSRRWPLVGPEAMGLRDYLGRLRAAMGLERPPLYLSIPLPLMTLAARAGRHLPAGLLDPEALSMLERGNTAESASTSRLLGRKPKAVDCYVEPAYAGAVAAQARLRWLLPVLRLSIAMVWIATGIVSAFFYPAQSSYELLARTGTPEWLMPVFLYGAAALDMLFGLLALAPRRSRRLWAMQAALVLAYTVVITVKLPEFWLHPYGPVLKNLPFLAALWILYEFEERSWTT